jgi:uncharacterized protein with von Willebrand factor type A (vWA) domain
MVQAYQGYFQSDGRFISDNVSIKIPTMRRVIVNVLDDEIIENKSQSQRKAFDKFVKAISKCEPLGTDFDEAMKEGVHVGGELEL